MARYDRGSGNPRGLRGGRGRGYDASFGSWGDEWGSSPSAGFRGRGVGMYRDWGTRWEAGPRGYDRGVYGGDYPMYGGFPGGAQRGAYYGGRMGALGYDVGYAREPFLPEEAYRRHPEYDRPQLHRHDRWPDRGHARSARGAMTSDEEIREAVRQSLYQDNWVDPSRIDVEVNQGIVTLRGEVDDYLEARYAWDDAWETAGVHGVINHLHVRVDGPAGRHDTMVQTSGGRTAAEDGAGRG